MSTYIKINTHQVRTTLEYWWTGIVTHRVLVTGSKKRKKKQPWSHTRTFYILYHYHRVMWWPARTSCGKYMVRARLPPYINHHKLNFRSNMYGKLKMTINSCCVRPLNRYTFKVIKYCNMKCFKQVKGNLIACNDNVLQKKVKYISFIFWIISK